MAEPAAQLAPGDLAVDHAMAQFSDGLRFLLDVTPVDPEPLREQFLASPHEPQFTYRDLESDPAVLSEMLAAIDLSRVEEPMVAQLLRRKHRELQLQVEMLRARDTEDFRALSLELYGGVSPDLRERAEAIIAAVDQPDRADERVDAEAFLVLAEVEIEHYRQAAPGVEMHAEIRPDVSGVMVSGNTLLIGPETSVDSRRANALLQHEVGTHLVTQANGSGQPITLLGSGLAGYDETQEGLAVLAEILCGGLTLSRLRQLAARVTTCHRMVQGASFVEAWQALVDAGFPGSGAFTTVMRIYRSGGLTKDAIYLRGLVDLLGHVQEGGSLDLLFLGKFALEDLPVVADLHERGLLEPARLSPRYTSDPEAARRLDQAAHADHLTDLVMGALS